MLTLLTFHPDNVELFTSNHVDKVLKQIDSSRNIWLRCIHFRDRTGTAKIIKHFGLNPSRVNMIFNHSPVVSSRPYFYQLLLCLVFMA